MLRESGPRGLYALHRRYRPGDYENWKYIAPVQKAAWVHKSFEDGRWGGEIRSELQLNKHGIDQLIVIGLIAHT